MKKQAATAKVLIHYKLRTQGAGYGLDCIGMIGRIVGRDRQCVLLSFFDGAQRVWFLRKEVSVEV